MRSSSTQLAPSIAGFLAALAVLSFLFPALLILYKVGIDLSRLVGPQGVTALHDSVALAGHGRGALVTMIPFAWLAAAVVFAIPTLLVGSLQYVVLCKLELTSYPSTALAGGLGAPLVPLVLVFTVTGGTYPIHGFLLESVFFVPFGLLQGLAYRAVAGISRSNSPADGELEPLLLHEPVSSV